MARKSRLDVIKERFGPHWSWNQDESCWICKDGRRIFKQSVCSCWVWGKYDCKCKPVFMIREKGGQSRQIDLEDPKVYRLNGINTKKD